MTCKDYKFNGKWAYNKRIDGNRVMTISASIWYNMKRRCRRTNKNISYENCKIDDLFLDFQLFTDWHTKQIGYGRGFHLDKDLIGNGKMYGPDCCVLIPQGLNNFLCEMNSRRGECPLGVTKYRGKFLAQIQVDGTNIFLGIYKNPQEAYEVYLAAKSQHAKQWATRLLGQVDDRVIEKLLDYKPKNPRAWIVDMETL